MPDPTLLLPLAFAMILIGGFAGVLAGLLGVGGGIVLVPSFFYTFAALGYGGPMLMQMCLATSLATIVVTSIRSVQRHHAKGAVDWAILRGWAPGIALGAVLGMWLATGLRTETLTAIFGALALVVALYFGIGGSHWRLSDDMPGRVGRTVLSPVLGFLSVLMGIGGGSFGVPLMTLFGQPIHRAIATAAGFGLAIAVPSAIGFLLVATPEHAPPLTLGLINVPAFLVIIAMTLITTPWGVRIAHAMDAGPLKRVFGAFLTLVALNMLRATWMG